jgi:putative effector of murein hydrolase LrgA (UPF0299 family)
MRNLDLLLSPATVGVIRAAGLHKVAGAMVGVDEMTLPIAANIIGARAYLRRKTAKLVADGIISLAATTDKTAMTAEAAANLRRSVTPATKGR